MYRKVIKMIVSQYVLRWTGPGTGNLQGKCSGDFSLPGLGLVLGRLRTGDNLFRGHVLGLVLTCLDY